jgi:hypothetical protein
MYTCMRVCVCVCVCVCDARNSSVMYTLPTAGRRAAPRLGTVGRMTRMHASSEAGGRGGLFKASDAQQGRQRGG